MALNILTSDESYLDEPITEIGPTKAIIDSELACFHMTTHILKSHKQLTDDEIEYAANYISSFYSYSLDMLSKDFNNVLSDDQLIMVLTYADQKCIGKFALTFNNELITAIKNKDIVSLKHLLLGPKEMFIELYNNPYLSQHDKDFILRIVYREISTNSLLFDSIKQKIMDPNTMVTNLTSLSNKCYDDICIQDANFLDDDISRAIMSQHERTPNTVYTVDKPTDSDNPKIYCFDTIELISAVTNNFPINPISKQPFSDYTLKLINQRFNKEIAMYRRYKELTR